MFRFTIRDVLWLMALVAMACAWWLQWRHSKAEVAALRRASQLAAERMRFTSGPGTPIPAIPNPCPTPEAFIRVLREERNWYQFADKTADPFVKTPVADEALPLLIELLKDTDPEVRTRAVCTIGKMNRHADVSVPALIPMLDDPGPNVRWHAAFALSLFGPEAKAAIPAMLRQIEDADSPIAAFSADVIRKIDPTVKMENALIGLLKNRLDENRERAVSALFMAKPSEQLKVALVDAFARETNDKIRDQMAQLIAAIDASVSGKEAASPAGGER